MDLVSVSAGGPEGCALVQQREAQMEQLRQAKERHTRREIWVKEYHGGPYRKVPRLHHRLKSHAP